MRRRDFIALAGMFPLWTHYAPTSSVAAGAIVLTPEQGRAALEASWGSAAPGTTIVLRGGRWDLGNEQGLFLAGKSGVAGKPITIMGYPGETTILNGSKLTGEYFGISSAGGYGVVMYMLNYVNLENLIIEQCPWGGLVLTGNGTTTNMLKTTGANNCVVRNVVCRRHGWGGTEGKGVSVFCNSNNNLLEEVASYENVDKAGDKADGFQISALGAGNVLRLCQAHHNSNDGFDLFNIHNGTKEGAVTLDRCLSWANGYKADGSRAGGDGNGFKLGGGRARTNTQSGGHHVTRCAAWGNGANGFDDNTATLGITIEQSVAYRNSKYRAGTYREFEMRTGIAHVLRHNVALPALIEAGKNKQHDNSWNRGTVQDSDFVSVDQGSPEFLRIRPASKFAGLGI